MVCGPKERDCEIRCQRLQLTLFPWDRDINTGTFLIFIFEVFSKKCSINVLPSDLFIILAELTDFSVFQNLTKKVILGDPLIEPSIWP